MKDGSNSNIICTGFPLNGRASEEQVFPQAMKATLRAYDGLSFVDIDEMEPLFVVEGGTMVYRLGRIRKEQHFWKKGNIFPAGFCSVRLWRSMNDPRIVVRYKSEILTNGSKKPLFKLEPEDGEPIIGKSCTQVWNNVQKEINKFTHSKANVSGTKNFGLSSRKVKEAISALEGAVAVLEMMMKKEIEQSHRNKGKKNKSLVVKNSSTPGKREILELTSGSVKLKERPHGRSICEPVRKHKSLKHLKTGKQIRQENNKTIQTEPKARKRKYIITGTKDGRSVREMSYDQIQGIKQSKRARKACGYPIFDDVITFKYDEKTQEVAICDKKRNVKEHFPDLAPPERYDKAQSAEGKIVLCQSHIHGCGVIAKEPIPANTIIIEYMGELIREPLSNLRERYYNATGKDCYMFRLDSEFIVDATMSGNLARMINHSCGPNCVAKTLKAAYGNTNHVVIISGRPIDAGEEITYDYNFITEDIEDKIQCKCGSSKCRGYMN